MLAARIATTARKRSRLGIAARAHPIGAGGRSEYDHVRPALASVLRNRAVARSFGLK
jgi:hypothetical protein